MWTLIIAAEILAIDLFQPLELIEEPVEITLISPDDADLQRQVSRVSADPSENLVLRLSSVEADEASGVSWEVHLVSVQNADCRERSVLIGVLSPFGVRSDTEFAFSLASAVGAGSPSGLKLIFRPVSGIEKDGEPVPPTVRGTMRIGGILLESETAAGRRDSPR